MTSVASHIKYHFVVYLFYGLPITLFLVLLVRLVSRGGLRTPVGRRQFWLGLFIFTLLALGLALRDATRSNFDFPPLTAFDVAFGLRFLVFPGVYLCQLLLLNARSQPRT